MVCEKCEKKLGRVITPDTWKDGARNTTESGGRKLNENKMLTSKKARFVAWSFMLQHHSLDMQKLCPSVWFTLLPGMCLQKRNLCHVWEEGY
ncbi:cysteine-rich PDZ-binding protein isoform X2 [Carassius carassius]|uniref:cysteine-rich PDZ-binding protein isoform X2 n=1 Tax=Carassius gibelio TaxID=101364 RepID=UPI002278540D|nr:cysteine-rich PDZ-binding protein isoform X2 [Carassius gibelio]XP_059386917.1 cysteine-rich PDZ-binding protein isoform X2 [Carassius carassius]